jgi:zinc protease
MSLAIAVTADCDTAVELPKEAVIRKTLDNGLVVFAKRSGPPGLVAIDVKVMAGSSLEGHYLGSGISHLVEHMVFKGTRKRPAGSIEREVKSLGGTINGSVSQDLTSYYLLIPSGALSEGLSILKDMLADPAFDKGELGKEKGVVLREVALDEDEPQARIIRTLYETAYTDHGYKYPPIGYSGPLKALGREDLVRYHARMYVPNRMVVTIVGDIDPAAAIGKAESEFRDFGRPDYAPVPAGPAERRQMAERNVEGDSRVNLAYIALGYHSNGILDDDLYAMDVLAMILGRGDDSRLNRSLVKDKKLAHSVSAWNNTPRDPGLFTVTAIADKDKAAAAEAEMRAQIEAIKEGLTSDDELATAKRTALADHLSSLETVDSQADDIGSNFMLTGDPGFMRRYVERVQKVTKEDVQRVARRYLDGTNLSAVMLARPAQGGRETTGSKEPAAQDTIERELLPNGIRVLAHADAKTPTVAITAAILGGISAEKAADNGISDLTARMLLAGTGKRDKPEIVGKIESLGGSIGAFSGLNSFGINIRVLKPDLATALDILADVLEDPRFPQREIDIEKSLMIAGISREDDDIFDAGFNAVRKALFEPTPYALRIKGTVDTVRAMTRDEIVSFYSARVAPRYMVISLSGDVNPKEAIEMVRSRFSGMKGEGEPIPPPGKSRPAERTISITMDKDQSLVLIGYEKVGTEDRRRYALEVLSSVLSGQSGRIFDELRNKRALAYALGCTQKLGLGKGMLVCYIACSKERVAEATQALTDEIGKIRRSGVSAEDLRMAKTELMVGRKVLRQSNEFNALNAALDELYGLGYMNIYRYDPEIELVTAEDVRGAAERFLGPDAQVTVRITSK